MRLWIALREFFRPGDVVSHRWLKDQDRAEATQGIESVCVRWPINKFINEHARWNTLRLRKRA